MEKIIKKYATLLQVYNCIKDSCIIIFVCMCAHMDVFVCEAEYLNLEMTKEEQNISKKTKTDCCSTEALWTSTCHNRALPQLQPET